MNVVFIITATGVTLTFLYLNEFTYWAYLMTFAWGLQDGAVNTLCQEMLGFEFDNNQEPYAVLNMIQSLTGFAVQIIQSFVDT